MNLDTDLIPLTKTNSKWVTDLNVKHKTVKRLRDDRGENQDDLGDGDAFLDKTSKTQSTNEITGKLDLIKIKSFCSANGSGNRMRRQDTKQEKISSKDTSGGPGELSRLRVCLRVKIPGSWDGVPHQAPAL